MREWMQFPCEPREQIGDYQEVLLAAYEFVGSSGEV